MTSRLGAIAVSTLYWVLGGAAVLGGSVALYGAHERAIGVAQAETKVVRDSLVVQTHRADSLANAFRIDTVRLTKQIVRSDTQLVHLIDTAIVHHTDTVKVPVTVLVQADSTIKACRITLSDCAKGWDAEKAVSASLRAELAATRAQLPSKAGTVLRAVIWGSVGYLAGHVTK